MSQRQIDLIKLLCVGLLIIGAFMGYDRFVDSQRLLMPDRPPMADENPGSEVIQLSARAEPQSSSAVAAVQKQELELELKRLELEIKRAEADRAAAQVRIKEIEATQADKQREADKAEQTAELARMNAETKHEEDKREQTRRETAAVKSALQERAESAGRLNSVSLRKDAAQRAVIIWKNRIAAARNAKARAQNDLANSQAGQSAPGGVVQRGERSGTGVMVFDHGVDVSAVEQQAAAAGRSETEAVAALAKAQAELDAVNAEYESALTSKQNADRRLAAVAPPRDKNKVVASYGLTDGRKLDALCVIESGDDVWIKTSSGIVLIKRGDIEEVVKQ